MSNKIKIPNSNKEYSKSLDLPLIGKKAVSFAKKTVKEYVRQEELGKFIGVYKYSRRVAAYYFESTKLGYTDWFFVITLSRKPFSTDFSFNEINLVASIDAPVGKSWVSFEERLVPNDIHSNVELPFRKFDKNLTQGFPKKVQQKPNLNKNQKRDFYNMQKLVATYALSRERVLSNFGKNQTYIRWNKNGKLNGIDKNNPCIKCGFYVPLKGTLGQAFGVCTNEWSINDSKVVGTTYSCNAHSQTGITPVFDRYQGPPLKLNENVIIEKREGTK